MPSGSRAIGVIPARFEATRFPGKPLAPIAGKPMIQWVHEHVSEAKTLDDVWIATEDTRIVQAAEQFGAQAVMTGSTLQSGTDRVFEAVRGQDFDIVVNIQGDEPLMPGAVVDQLVTFLREHPEYGMATACTALRDEASWRDPHHVKVVMNPCKEALYFSRAPIPSGPAARLATRLERQGGLWGYLHLGIYAFRYKTLEQFVNLPPSALEYEESLEQLRALENGIPIVVLETPHTSRGVDTPEDVPVVEALMRTAGMT